jgi:hypothetical protein
LGLLQVGLYRVESGGKLGAHRRDAADNGDSNQGGDQAVFDGRGAIFVSDEVLEYLAQCVASKWDSRDVAQAHKSADGYMQTRLTGIVKVTRVNAAQPVRSSFSAR